MDYLKQNHLALLIIGWLVISPLLMGGESAVGAFDRTTVANPWTFSDGLTADDLTATDDLVVTDDATISGRSLVVTTSNTSTSTAVIGCIQTYATSTATAVKIVPVAYATTTLGFGGQTAGMSVVALFGTCP